MLFSVLLLSLSSLSAATAAAFPALFDHTCPDGQQTCADGEPCCAFDPSEYGCCGGGGTESCCADDTGGVCCVS